MSYLVLFIPVISAFIGYITNLIAIKMLFHPRKPLKVFGFTIQGIFPKRQKQFATKLGKLVGEELLSFQDIEEKITREDNIKKLHPVIESHIDDFLRNKLGSKMPMIAMFIGDKTITELKGIFIQELEAIFPDIMKNYIGNLRQDLDLEKIVTKKVEEFSSDRLESILYQIMAKEFRFVEILGGILGFLIGLIQVAITYFATYP